MDAPANGMAAPYFEDEDPSQIVTKPLSKFIYLIRGIV